MYLWRTYKMYVGSRALSHLIQINLTKQVIRSHRNFARKRKVVDPGIQNRKRLLDDDKEIEQLNDYDFDMEANFMNMGKTYQEYVQEGKLQQQKDKYLIVKQKYFKEKLPNFLTWSDKEQIRYLHSTNPEEWSIEKLSEGFPALPEVIAKIATSTWTKKGDNQTRNHDKSVQNNWTLFKEGKLTDLPPDVVEHLNKFTDRKLNFEPFRVAEEMKVENNKSMLAPNIKVGTEFSEIIKSYERLKNKNSNTAELQTKSKLQKPPKEDTYLLGGSNTTQYSQHVTLEHLENKILKKAQEGKLLSNEVDLLQERHVEMNMKTKVDEKYLHCKDLKLSDSHKTSKIVNSKYTTSEISTTVKHDSNIDYPEKIIIPRDKLQRGCTYKLNDCYYDDDGEFLYRVPGMYK